jgi:hypothetical protein
MHSVMRIEFDPLTRDLKRSALPSFDAEQQAPEWLSPDE